MGLIADLKGTSAGSFLIAIGGVLLKHTAGTLQIRNAGDTADAELTASKLNLSGNAIDLNADAAGSGADWLYRLQRPSTGMAAAVTLTLPVDDGSPSQVLQTDGNGVLNWTSIAGTGDQVAKDTTALAFGSSGVVAMFTLPLRHD
jgi:hypothetical protein